MSLWRHPRTAAALCIAAVLACAAAPAAFLAASDAAYFGRVETVADPYRAPTPTADDYYILRQLAARGQDTTARQTTPQQEQDAAPQTPKVYIGASASIESMTWADTATTTAAGKYSSTTKTVTVYGATPAYAPINGQTVLLGRFLTQADVENHTSVCIITEKTAEDMVGYTDCLGEEISLV